MNRLNEFLKLFDQVLDNCKDQNIICGSGIGTALFDHEKFKYCDNGLKKFLTPYYNGGSQYIIGYIGKTRILVEPGIEFNDMNVYDSKFKRLYNFRMDKFKLEELI